MKLLVLSAAEVRAGLDPQTCRELMRTALTALASNQVFQPLRTVVRPPALPGVIALMTTHLEGTAGAFGMKSVCVFHDNPTRGKDAHQGVVTLFDASTGEPLALLNASAITEVRTAAVSAIGTQALARPDSQVLTVFGSGTQASAHVAALTEVLPFSQVRVVSRRPDGAQQFVDGLRLPDGTRASAFSDPRAACMGADVVVTATTSPTPVLFRAWVEPGTHINAVGSSIPTAAELEPALLGASTLVADSRESLVNESGDYLQAVQAGALGPDDVHGELGEVLLGHLAGRVSAEEITIFKSLGLAVEDIVAARHLYEQALARGTGTWVDF